MSEQTERRVRVLVFVDELGTGGIQTLLYDLQCELADSPVEIHYLALDYGRPSPLAEPLRALGATLYQLQGVRLERPSDFPRYFRALRDFFAAHHDYQAVHLHASSKNFAVLYYAAKFGIPVRVAHSHTTGFVTRAPLKRFSGWLVKPILRHYATHWFACSALAGRWLFGKRAVADGRVRILPNGIPLDRFAFSEPTRRRMREALGLQPDQLTICHVGQFVPAKNHSFLLEIFACLHEREPDARLLLVGGGNETAQRQCREQAERRGIADAVCFLGQRDDVADLLQAADVFVMPSIFEGLPIAGVEAQAAGCACLFSDIVTREVALLDETRFLSLSLPPAAWADALRESRGAVDRAGAADRLRERGFDIRSTAAQLEAFYLSFAPAPAAQE